MPNSIAAEALKVPLYVATGALTVGVIVVGAFQLFGPHECVQSMLKQSFGDSHDLGKVFVGCTGWDPFNHGDAGAMITGPKKLEEKPTGTELTMSFGDVEETLVYPRHKGKLTKVDWYGGLGHLVVTGTRFVDDKPFAVDYTPCVKLADDYRNVKIGEQQPPINEAATTTTVDGSADGDKKAKESTLAIQYVKDATGKVTKIIAKSGPLTACDVRFSDDADKQISRHHDGDVNNGIEKTFDFVTNDLAKKYAAATACPEKQVDQTKMKDNIANYVLGAVVKDQPTLAGTPVEVELGDPQIARDYFRLQFQQTVDKDEKLSKSMYPDSDHRYHGMSVKFSDKNMLDNSSCGAKAA